MNGLQQEAALASILRKHFPLEEFPGVSNADIDKISQDLTRSLDTANALEALERSDKKPENDVELLRKAADKLRLAAEIIEQVGWHAQKHLGEVIDRSFTDFENDRLPWCGSGQSARTEITARLRTIQDALTKASRQVDVDGIPLYAAITGDTEQAEFQAGRNKQTAAYLFAKDCAHVFFEFTDKKPAVHTNPYEQGNPAYGPFFDLVKDAFAAVGIQASVETWARRACKEFSPKSPD